MECDICLVEWDSRIRIPRLLNCGHTFCEVCLISLFLKSKSYGKVLCCPTCSRTQKEVQSQDDVKNLLKNFTLLGIVDKIEKRLSSMNSDFFKDIKQTINKAKSFSSINQDSDLFSEHFCTKHNSKALLQAIGKKTLLCEVCIKDNNTKGYPLLSVLRDFRRKCDSINTKISLFTMEIERLQDFLVSYSEEFYEVNKKKIDDLFNYILKIVQYNYNSSLSILEQCKKDQNEKILIKMKEIDTIKEELIEFDKQITTIMQDDVQNILKNNNIINSINIKIDDLINYNSELELLTMKIGLKDEIKDNLIYTIHESYYIDVEQAKIQGEKPSVQHILKRNEYWECICGENYNTLDSVLCTYCSLLRKFESFPNILSHPNKANSQELEQLNLRKREECKIFHEKLNDKKNEGKMYAIDSEWFLLWKCYVTSDLSEKFIPNSKKRISINPDIGVLQPGPIYNHNLFENILDNRSEKILKKGLKKNEDYIAVNKDLWMFFHENYGGGPEIEINENGDIYSSIINLKNIIAKSNRRTSLTSPYNSLELFEKPKNDLSYLRKEQKIIPTYLTLNTEENNSKCDETDEILNENQIPKNIINKFPTKQLDEKQIVKR